MACPEWISLIKPVPILLTSVTAIACNISTSLSSEEGLKARSPHVKGANTPSSPKHTYPQLCSHSDCCTNPLLPLISSPSDASASLAPGSAGAHLPSS
eukprot:scaffold1306_cov399-Prasinococcus_capsulatus_cf.AAC.5